MSQFLSCQPRKFRGQIPRNGDEHETIRDLRQCSEVVGDRACIKFYLNPFKKILSTSHKETFKKMYVLSMSLCILLFNGMTYNILVTGAEDFGEKNASQVDASDNLLNCERHTIQTAEALLEYSFIDVISVMNGLRNVIQTVEIVTGLLMNPRILLYFSCIYFLFILQVAKTTNLVSSLKPNCQLNI